MPKVYVAYYPDGRGMEYVGEESVARLQAEGYRVEQVDPSQVSQNADGSISVSIAALQQQQTIANLLAQASAINAANQTAVQAYGALTQRGGMYLQNAIPLIGQAENYGLMANILAGDERAPYLAMPAALSRMAGVAQTQPNYAGIETYDAKEASDLVKKLAGEQTSAENQSKTMGGPAADKPKTGITTPPEGGTPASDTAALNKFGRVDDPNIYETRKSNDPAAVAARNAAAAQASVGTAPAAAVDTTSSPALAAADAGARARADLSQQNPEWWRTTPLGQFPATPAYLGAADLAARSKMMGSVEGMPSNEGDTSDIAWKRKYHAAIKKAGFGTGSEARARANASIGMREADAARLIKQGKNPYEKKAAAGGTYGGEMAKRSMFKRRAPGGTDLPDNDLFGGEGVSGPPLSPADVGALAPPETAAPPPGGLPLDPHTPNQSPENLAEIAAILSSPPSPSPSALEAAVRESWSLGPDGQPIFTGTFEDNAAVGTETLPAGGLDLGLVGGAPPPAPLPIEGGAPLQGAMPMPGGGPMDKPPLFARGGTRRMRAGGSQETDPNWPGNPLYPTVSLYPPDYPNSTPRPTAAAGSGRQAGQMPTYLPAPLPANRPGEKKVVPPGASTASAALAASVPSGAVVAKPQGAIDEKASRPRSEISGSGLPATGVPRQRATAGAGAGTSTGGGSTSADRVSGAGGGASSRAPSAPAGPTEAEWTLMSNYAAAQFGMSPEDARKEIEGDPEYMQSVLGMARAGELAGYETFARPVDAGTEPAPPAAADWSKDPENTRRNVEQAGVYQRDPAFQTAVRWRMANAGEDEATARLNLLNPTNRDYTESVLGMVRSGEAARQIGPPTSTGSPPPRSANPPMQPNLGEGIVGHLREATADMTPEERVAYIRDMLALTMQGGNTPLAGPNYGGMAVRRAGGGTDIGYYGGHGDPRTARPNFPGAAWQQWTALPGAAGGAPQGAVPGASLALPPPYVDTAPGALDLNRGSTWVARRPQMFSAGGQRFIVGEGVVNGQPGADELISVTPSPRGTVVHVDPLERRGTGIPAAVAASANLAVPGSPYRPKPGPPASPTGVGHMAQGGTDRVPRWRYLDDPRGGFQFGDPAWKIRNDPFLDHSLGGQQIEAGDAGDPDTYMAPIGPPAPWNVIPNAAGGTRFAAGGTEPLVAVPTRYPDNPYGPEMGDPHAVMVPRVPIGWVGGGAGGRAAGGGRYLPGQHEPYTGVNEMSDPWLPSPNAAGGTIALGVGGSYTPIAEGAKVVRVGSQPSSTGQVRVPRMGKKGMQSVPFYAAQPFPEPEFALSQDVNQMGEDDWRTLGLLTQQRRGISASQWQSLQKKARPWWQAPPPMGTNTNPF